MVRVASEHRRGFTWGIALGHSTLALLALLLTLSCTESASVDNGREDVASGVDPIQLVVDPLVHDPRLGVVSDVLPLATGQSEQLIVAGQYGALMQGAHRDSEFVRYPRSDTASIQRSRIAASAESVGFVVYTPFGVSNAKLVLPTGDVLWRAADRTGRPAIMPGLSASGVQILLGGGELESRTADGSVRWRFEYPSVVRNFASMVDWPNSGGSTLVSIPGGYLLLDGAGREIDRWDNRLNSAGADFSLLSCSADPSGYCIAIAGDNTLTILGVSNRQVVQEIVMEYLANIAVHPVNLGPGLERSLAVSGDVLIQGNEPFGLEKKLARLAVFDSSGTRRWERTFDSQRRILRVVSSSAPYEAILVGGPGLVERYHLRDVPRTN